ncbi:aldehyde dehydrogenase [Bacillaceae bacterium JMAK1]|nr:aldehyde dehydrogenase [Bacillaceae bacterium JMAK1]
MMNKLYINGDWVESTSTEMITVINPATEEVIGEVPKGTKEDVDRAVEGAFTAQKKWAKESGATRAEVARRIGEAIEKDKEEWIRLLVQEQGKTMDYARGEIDKSIQYCHYMAGFGLRMEGDTLPSERENEMLLVLKKPIGVVGGIVPWNFPVFVMLRKVIPPLVAGCSVVIKPSTETPLTAYKFAELVHELGLAPGLFQLVPGSGSEVGNAIAAHEKVSLVTMTGSFPAGSKVMEAAAANVKKVNLELGGKAPVIVTQNADIDEAVEHIVQSRIVNTGQVCTNAERVYVQESVIDTFNEKMADRMKAVKYGDPLKDSSVEMGPLISQDQLDDVVSAVQEAKEEGATIVVGGQAVTDRKGFFFEPTVITNAKHEMKIMTDEIFGPVLPITSYESLDQVIDWANDSEYGLSSSIFTNDYNEMMRAINELNFGEVYVNREHDEAIHGYHAGWRKSGVGGADGKYGFEDYLATTVAYLQYDRTKQ